MNRAFDCGLAPDKLLHRLLGLDPGAAGLAPTGGAEDGHLQPQTVGLGRRVADGREPLRRPEDDLLFDALPPARVHVGQLETGNPDPLHPLKVFGDAFEGDVAARPVPPSPRPRRLRRVGETAFEFFATGLRSRRDRTRQQPRRGQGRDESLPRLPHLFIWNCSEEFGQWNLYTKRMRTRTRLRSPSRAGRG